ncbi:hypothetical protein K491DRAFT_391481 [Lophiostoma macrostomum CBS 122681]|uniref:Actin-like ATPase domain-containing protein n=1 Tax=Lophiostoma macrostomum CBS 122681 TaxID=1314788 RepID=A0A6A6TBS8_9PLEO|nr:hypothetical protein K491DRAFT_391481 [Lophiostoma macrostomum CBS 122681]
MSEPITPRSQRQATKANRYKFFLGIDIGTTRTNVSYIRIIEKSRKVAQWSDVIDVGQWNPGTASVFKGPGRQVPTESLYTIRERQISHGWEATKIPITSSGDDDAVHICRAKPLSGYPEDGHWPQHLQDALKRLTKAKLIEKEEEVDIFEVNFMRWVLTRVKETLLRVGYTEDSDVEIYVCCPVAWVQKDRRRFKRNMARAAREVEMGDYFLTKQGVAFTRNGETKYDIKECDSLNRVRVLTEAEAAAIFLIATTEAQDLGILPGTTIITGDIGGGTVDFSCFQLSDDSKPRLRRQLCPPSGMNTMHHVCSQKRREH